MGEIFSLGRCFAFNLLDNSTSPIIPFSVRKCKGYLYDFTWFLLLLNQMLTVGDWNIVVRILNKRWTRLQSSAHKCGSAALVWDWI